MRKLDITDYVVDADGQEVMYQVKKSIVAILFHPDLKLTAYQLLETNKLAEKISKGDDSVLLEEAEWSTLKKAIDTVKGYSMNDVEFVERVLDCPEVNVAEA